MQTRWWWVGVGVKQRRAVTWSARGRAPRLLLLTIQWLHNPPIFHRPTDNSHNQKFSELICIISTPTSFFFNICKAPHHWSIPPRVNLINISHLFSHRLSLVIELSVDWIKIKFNVSVFSPISGRVSVWNGAIALVLFITDTNQFINRLVVAAAAAGWYSHCFFSNRLFTSLKLT